MKKLELIYPVNSVLISQIFGVNKEFYSDPKYGGILGHNGIDFFAGHGTPIYATHDGQASYQVDGGGGHGVVIITNEEFLDDKGTPSYFKTIYWHMVNGLKEPALASPLQGKTGFTKVSMGDLIGYADNTGASTGDHLHFGLKTVAKGEDWGSWMNTNQNNGFLGAIDPAPYFDGFHEQQVVIMKKQIGLLQQLIDLLIKLRDAKK